MAKKEREIRGKLLPGSLLLWANIVGVNGYVMLQELRVRDSHC